MATNEDVEMRWVSAWSDLSEITGGSPVFPCMLEDYTPVDQSWLQNSAYDGWLVKVEAKKIHGKTIAFASRWREDNGDTNHSV